jgi:hypothetical protein
MAEKRFIKGLFKDTGHIDQPEGSWRHARNMIINATDGAVSNEGGNYIAGHLGQNPTVGAQNDKIVGTIEASNNITIFFIVSVGVANPRSEIGIYQDEIYTPIFNPAIIGPSGKATNDLNFRISHPIEGTFKIDSKGDLVVYFTDDLNPPRAFNVSRQQRESTGMHHGSPPWREVLPTKKIRMEHRGSPPLWEVLTNTRMRIKFRMRWGVHHKAPPVREVLPKTETTINYQGSPPLRKVMPKIRMRRKTYRGSRSTRMRLILICTLAQLRQRQHGCRQDYAGAAVPPAQLCCRRAWKRNPRGPLPTQTIGCRQVW